MNNTSPSKYIKDGLVAVLYSPGFGAGWSTWADDKHSEAILFDPDIAKLVEEYEFCNKCGIGVDKEEQLYKIVESKYPKGDIYTDSASQLRILWLPIGTKFRVDEYDGSESVVIESEERWITA